MPTHPTLQALACPGVKSLALARFARAAGGTALVTALRWHVYDVGGEASALGWLGLVEFLPVIPLGLVAGALVDATDRVRVAALSQLGFALAAFALALGSDAGLGMLLACAFASAVWSAFEFPAVATILPSLVPRTIFPSAVSLVATSRNLGWTLGPLLGGAGLQWIGVSGTFATSGMIVAASALLVTTLPRAEAPAERREVSLRAIREGIAFVRAELPVLGAMTLDLFAVLFAGATALLPLYAKLLGVTGVGYGVLTAAITIGTFLMSATMLTSSAIPATISANTESGNQRESPNVIVARPNTATAPSSPRPGHVMGGRIIRIASGSGLVSSSLPRIVPGPPDRTPAVAWA